LPFVSNPSRSQPHGWYQGIALAMPQRSKISGAFRRWGAPFNLLLVEWGVWFQRRISFLGDAGLVFVIPGREQSASFPFPFRESFVKSPFHHKSHLTYSLQRK
jgi:hypothetical protein